VQPGLDVAALVQANCEQEESNQPEGSIRSVAVSRENRPVSIGPEINCGQRAGMETPRLHRVSWTGLGSCRSRFMGPPFHPNSRLVSITVW
jgi:hypothetical protein